MAVQFQRFMRVVNPTVHFRADGSSVVHLPGFSYDDFNRAGFLSIVQLNRMSEMNRVHFHGVKMQLSKDIDINKILMFAIGRHWIVSPRLYQQAAVNFPMTLDCRITALGRTTIDIKQTYHELTDNGKVEPLASIVLRLGHVDPSTRKSSPLPNQLRLAAESIIAKSLAREERFPEVREPQAVPSSTFSCKVQVRYDDMDLLLHTNQGFYLAYAMECASRAAESGFYSKVVGDVAFYPVKRSTMLFKGETRAGDTLALSTWEDSNNPFLLNFLMTKQEKIVCFIQIEFFEKQTD